MAIEKSLHYLNKILLEGDSNLNEQKIEMFITVKTYIEKKPSNLKSLSGFKLLFTVYYYTFINVNICSNTTLYDM